MRHLIDIYPKFSRPKQDLTFPSPVALLVAKRVAERPTAGWRQRDWPNDWKRHTSSPGFTILDLHIFKRIQTSRHCRPLTRDFLKWPRSTPGCSRFVSKSPPTFGSASTLSDIVKRTLDASLSDTVPELVNFNLILNLRLSNITETLVLHQTDLPLTH